MVGVPYSLCIHGKLSHIPALRYDGRASKRVIQCMDHFKLGTQFKFTEVTRRVWVSRNCSSWCSRTTLSPPTGNLSSCVHISSGELLRISTESASSTNAAVVLTLPTKPHKHTTTPRSHSINASASGTLISPAENPHARARAYHLHTRARGDACGTPVCRTCGTRLRGNTSGAHGNVMFARQFCVCASSGGSCSGGAPARFWSATTRACVLDPNAGYICTASLTNYIGIVCEPVRTRIS